MGVRSIDLKVDVTEAAGLGEPAHIALTVTVPQDADAVGADPIVCFSKPGAGYSRGYFTTDLPGPGPGKGAQADWHAERGWIFVSVDHLGVGESSLHGAEPLGLAAVAAASEAAEADVLQRLAAGTLMDGLRKVDVARAVKVGIGQSMGGCLTVVQQGRHHSYDGVGVLGFGVLGTLPKTAPGTPPIALPWLPRDAALEDGVVTNGAALAALDPAANPGPSAMAWGFHYDDIPAEVLARDMDDYPARRGELPPWGSATIPVPAVLWGVGPGAVMVEAAAITAPVLVAMGERDVLDDPRGELRAYASSDSVDFYVCPRMAHMHNFAGTREELWARIETWAEWVRARRDARAAAAPG
ncbi:MAG TPA: hypothetical protein VIY26_16360 [Acidimicrobiales bacterium]